MRILILLLFLVGCVSAPTAPIGTTLEIPSAELQTYTLPYFGVSFQVPENWEPYIEEKEDTYTTIEGTMVLSGHYRGVFDVPFVSYGLEEGDYPEIGYFTMHVVRGTLFEGTEFVDSQMGQFEEDEILYGDETIEVLGTSDANLGAVTGKRLDFKFSSPERDIEGYIEPAYEEVGFIIWAFNQGTTYTISWRASPVTDEHYKETIEEMVNKITIS